MAKFFKTFAKGILYIITLPLLIVFLAIYLVISLCSFIFLSIQGIILFFKGENLVGEMVEDRIAKERLDALSGASNQETINDQPIQAQREIIQNNNEVKQEQNIIQEEQVSFNLNNLDNANIEREEDIVDNSYSFEPEPEPEEEITHEYIQSEEEILVNNDYRNSHEYIVEEDIKEKERQGGVDFFDFEGKED